MAFERPRLPVVMFHTVREPDPDWLWDGLTCPVPMFERMIASLRSRGYGPARLDDLVALQESGTKPAGRRIVLTFDDGYLDNWVYVYPLLKRAGLRGIVYVNPEFVDPGKELRPTLADVWSGRIAATDLQTRGFLNWSEIEYLDREGVLEIGSHSMSHTWYPTSSRIVDYHRPGLDTPWLAWNARPERKPFYRVEDQSGFVPWGTPVFESGRSLGIRRYFPDPGVAAAVTSFVASHGGREYFQRPDWQVRLDEVAARSDAGQGRYESDEERDERYRHEIAGAFAILEARLDRPIRHFCWPGGAYCDESWQALEAAGYRSTTLRRNDRRRWETTEPRLVRRISEHRRFSFAGRSWSNGDPSLLATACDIELGRRSAPWELKLRKAVSAARTFAVRG